MRSFRAKDGGRYWTRTSDPLRVRQEGTSQESLQTLGETNTGDIGVTKSVTPETENGMKAALLQALKEMPKGDLIALLAEAISGPPRGNRE